MIIRVKQVGLAAYILQKDSSSDGDYKFYEGTREYEFESSKSLEQWAIIYECSQEKVHDQIVMRIRPKR